MALDKLKNSLACDPDYAIIKTKRGQFLSCGEVVDAGDILTAHHFSSNIKFHNPDFDYYLVKVIKVKGYRAVQPMDWFIEDAK